jgi:hypothetical protein
MKAIFRHGARVAPKQYLRGEIRRIELPLPSAPPDIASYDLAVANLHKPWARRWMRNLAIQYRAPFNGF